MSHLWKLSESDMKSLGIGPQPAENPWRYDSYDPEFAPLQQRPGENVATKGSASSKVVVEEPIRDDYTQSFSLTAPRSIPERTIVVPTQRQVSKNAVTRELPNSLVHRKQQIKFVPYDPSKAAKVDQKRRAYDSDYKKRRLLKKQQRSATHAAAATYHPDQQDENERDFDNWLYGNFGNR